MSENHAGPLNCSLRQRTHGIWYAGVILAFLEFLVWTRCREFVSDIIQRVESPRLITLKNQTCSIFRHWHTSWKRGGQQHVSVLLFVFSRDKLNRDCMNGPQPTLDSLSTPPPPTHNRDNCHDNEIWSMPHCRFLSCENATLGWFHMSWFSMIAPTNWNPAHCGCAFGAQWYAVTAPQITGGLKNCGSLSRIKQIVGIQ